MDEHFSQTTSRVPVVGHPYTSMEKLGARARRRRDDLNLTREFVAAAIGSTNSTLYNAEMCLKAETYSFETAWEEALQVPRGWLRNQKLTAPPVGRFPGSVSPNESVAEEMSRFICWYARHACTDRTIHFAELDDDEKDIAETVMIYYGLHGEAMAHISARTREEKAAGQKQKQKVTRWARRLQPLPVLASLKRLQAAMPAVMPGTLDFINTRLASIIGGKLSIEGANRFAQEVFSVTLANIKQEDIAAGGHILSYLEGPSDIFIEEVRCAAVDMVRSVGAAQIHFITAVAGEEIGRPFSCAVALECCRSQTGFEWLSEIEGWFWFGPNEDNWAIRSAMKVLCACNAPILEEDLQAGILRNLDQRPTGGKYTSCVQPPATVISAMLRRTFNIEGNVYNDLQLVGNIDNRSVLSDAERKIYDALQSFGGAASEGELTKSLVALGGLDGQSLRQVLNTSPIVKATQPSIWALRGTMLDPNALLRAFSCRETEPRQVSNESVL